MKDQILGILIVPGSCWRKRFDRNRRNRQTQLFLLFLHQPRKFWCFHIPSQAEHAENADAVPVHVAFVPCQSMTGRLGMGMVIVVPAFAERQHGYPEAVLRGVSSNEALPAPHMGGRIDEPRRM